MKYLDLVKRTASIAGVSQAEAKRVLDSAMEIVKDTVNEGEEVTLNGVGKIGKKIRAARTGLNPANGLQIEIPEKNVVTFKPAKEFKDLIN